MYLMTLQVLLILSFATVDCQLNKKHGSTVATTTAARNGGTRKYRTRSTTVQHRDQQRNL